MVLTKRQKFEIEKFHQDPLPSRAEAVTKNALNFYRTVLCPNLLFHQCLATDGITVALTRGVTGATKVPKSIPTRKSRP